MVLCNPKIKIFDLQKITVGLIQEPHTDVLRCNVCWGEGGSILSGDCKLCFSCNPSTSFLLVALALKHLKALEFLIFLSILMNTHGPTKGKCNVYKEYKA